ncbi:hypothetical protein GCM10028805_19660 [Spirosoma harenae]
MVQKIKHLLSRLASAFLRLIGIAVLTKDQTETFLKPYLIASNPATRLQLPAVPNALDPTRLIFSPIEIMTLPSYVWSYPHNGQTLKQLPYGSWLVSTQLLCTNFGDNHLLKNLKSWQGRKPYIAKTAIAPWSNYIDGVAYGGYYDFMMLVAAQLCRIKDALSDTEFITSIVSYPLFNTSYEQEFLALIGLSSERIIDSRVQAVRAERIILGNNGHWFYPNIADILSLRKHIESQLKFERKTRNRIYISRSGRRCLANEQELRSLLDKYHFVYIEDRPRSIAEQVDIYKNASFIIGPHGASFTNIIWCEPDTQLLELFSPNYVSVHFRYLAAIMQMRYAAYYQGNPKENQFAALEENIYVSVPELEKYLIGLLATA